MRLAFVITCIAAAARSAAADEPDRTAYLSLPITLGVTSRDGGRFASGFRPELMVAPHRLGLAIGPYVEVARNSADTSLGTGLTLTYYRDETKLLALSPSAGVYHRFNDNGETGIALSLFAGARGNGGRGLVDVPVGVRIDFRSDDHANELVASASIDSFLFVGIALLGWLKGAHGG